MRIRKSIVGDVISMKTGREGEGREERRREGRGRERKKREYVQMLQKTQKNSNYLFNLDQSFAESHHRFQRNLVPSVFLVVKFLS